MDTPKYKHDCDKCTFITHNEESNSDFYICLNEEYPERSSCIARHSDVPSDYVSAPKFLAETTVGILPYKVLTEFNKVVYKLTNQ